MQTARLKIGMAHLKKEIDVAYFKYRDLMYKSMVVNILLYSRIYSPLLEHTVIEDRHYHDFMVNLHRSQLSDRDLLIHIDPTIGSTIQSDMMIYMEEFISLKHSSRMVNVYSLSIDDSYSTIIENRRLPLNAFKVINY